MRTILHIDFDSFFASVEEQHNPKLAGKVFGVTATNGRTCIIASSKAAKKFGIKTGFRSYEAKRIYSGIIFIPADFPKYWEVSQKFLNIAKDYSPFVELFSIDEVFMDITKTSHLFDGTVGIVNRIKTRIKNEIGQYVTVSIGISHNKLLAKLASGLGKPNGIIEIKPEDVERIFAKVKLTDVCGIGERIGERLNKIGVGTLLELRTTSLARLSAEFGNAEAQFLKNVSLALDDSPIIPYTEEPQVKSIGRNYCLPKNEYNRRIILQNIFELCEEVAIKLRRLKKKAKTVGIGLSGSFKIHEQKTSTLYFNNGKEMFDRILPLLRSNLDILDIGWNLNRTYVRMIRVWASGLQDCKNVPLSLFDQNESKERVIQAVDKINDRFGDHTIRNGFLLYADKLTTVPNGYMADKYERSKLATVSDT